MRCLTLAGRLAAAGTEVSLVAAEMIEPLRRLAAAAGVRLIELPSARPPERAREGWDKASWDEAAQDDDAARAAEALAGDHIDWIVVDHYGLDHVWETRMRDLAGRIAVIDDLATRRHDCDLLLDQTHRRDPADYEALVGSGTTLLIGARYALLRPEFEEARTAALARRQAPGPVDRLLISLGLTDVGGLTLPAARAALARTGAEIDVVLGGSAPTLEAVRRLADAEPRIALHVDTPHISELMTVADLAIGSAGTTSWERCCLGLPTLAFAVAGNQRLIAARLAEDGAVRLAEPEDEGTIGDALVALAEDEAARVRMAGAAAAICDGRGASRVAARLLDEGEPQWSA